MDARRQVEFLQRAKYLSCAWSWGCQKCLVLAGNIEDDSLETLVPSLRSISLSFQFLMRSPVFIHLGRERKAFSPVASLSGKLRKSLCNQPEGHNCASAQRHHGAEGLPRSIPRSQPASAAFTRRTKMSGFGKGSPMHSSLVQYQGRITALAFLARLQLCTSGPDISFAG